MLGHDLTVTGATKSTWTLPLTHWGRQKMTAISQTTFSSALYWITHRDQAMPMGHHWFRWWFLSCLEPGNYLNHCWILIKLTLRNKLEWIFKGHLSIFSDKNASENVGYFVSVPVRRDISNLKLACISLLRQQISCESGQTANLVVASASQ